MNLTEFCFDLYRQNNRAVDVKEFRTEFYRFSYVQKMLRMDTEETNMRMLLNYVIVIYNIFGNPATGIFVSQTKPEQLSKLKPLLEHFARIPPSKIVEDWQGNKVNFIHVIDDEFFKAKLLDELR